MCRKCAAVDGYSALAVLCCDRSRSTYGVFVVFTMSHRTLSLRLVCFFFLMIRRPPRSTLDRSSAASDVYKRQRLNGEVSPTSFDVVLADKGTLVLTGEIKVQSVHVYVDATVGVYASGW